MSCDRKWSGPDPAPPVRLRPGGRSGRSLDGTVLTTVDPDSGRYERNLLALVTASVLAAVLSTTVLTVSLPVVTRALGASAVEATWLLLAPLLAGSCLLVPLGRVADLVGRREMYLAGLGTFSLAALGAGFAPSVTGLLSALVVQSVGAAMVLCNTGAVLASVFRGPRLGAAMGVYLAGVSVGQLLGPVVGALTAESLGWQWLYWGQVPMGLVCLLLGARLLGRLPARTTTAVASPDLAGGVLLAALVASVLLTFSALQAAETTAAVLVAGPVAAVVLTAAFVVVEHRARRPLVPLSLFRRRTFVLANAANMLSVAPRFVSASVAGLFYQAVGGDSALTAGLKLLPLPVGITAGSLAAGWVIGRLGLRGTGVAGGVAMIAGLLALAVTLPAPGYAADVPGLLVLGLGGGLFGAPTSTLIVRAAPPDELGTVNGVRITLMNISGAAGIALGLAVATAAVPAPARAAVFRAQVSLADQQALADGVVAVVLLMAATALAAAVAVAGTRTDR